MAAEGVRDQGAAVRARASRRRRSRLPLLVVLEGCASHSEKMLPVRTALDEGQPREALRLLNQAMDVKSDADFPAEPRRRELALRPRSREHQSERRAVRRFEARLRVRRQGGRHARSRAQRGRLRSASTCSPGRAGSTRRLLTRSSSSTRSTCSTTSRSATSTGRGSRRGGSPSCRSTSPTTSTRATAPRSASGRSWRASPSRRAARPTRPCAGTTRRSSSRAFTPSAIRCGRCCRSGSTGRRASRSSRARAGRRPRSLDETGEGEIVFVVGYGRVPPKVAERVPIGLALTLFSGALAPNDVRRGQPDRGAGPRHLDQLPDARARAGRVHHSRGDARRALRPARTGRRRRARGPRRVEEDRGQDHRQRHHAHDRAVRVRAASSTRPPASTASSGSILNLGTQATLTALDTPDTRSWETLPARVAIARVRVPAGGTRVRSTPAASSATADVDVDKGGWAGGLADGPPLKRRLRSARMSRHDAVGSAMALGVRWVTPRGLAPGRLGLQFHVAALRTRSDVRAGLRGARARVPARGVRARVQPRPRSTRRGRGRSRSSPASRRPAARATTVRGLTAPPGLARTPTAGRPRRRRLRTSRKTRSDRWVPRGA